MPDVISKDALSFSQKYRFWLLLFAALLIFQIPLVSIPFKWLESYFHEISHGLAALITGGDIVKIQLFPNGAGLCTTRGGSEFLISFMGYMGAILWGTLIYSLASIHRRVAQVFSALLLVLLGFSVVLWTRDLLTLVIIIVLFVLVALQYKLPKQKYSQMSVQITGLLVLLNSLQSPLYLLDGRALGDGDALARITAIPEFIWVFIWFASALYCAYLLSRSNRRRK